MKVIEWVKLLLWLVGLSALGSFLYFKVWPMFKGGESERDGGGATPKINADKKAFKHSESELSQMTELLYDSMKEIGTDEVAVFRILNSINNAEFEQIYNNFGYRRSNMGQRGTFLGNEMSLVGWLKDELSTKQFESIKKRFIKSRVVFA